MAFPPDQEETNNGDFKCISELLCTQLHVKCCGLCCAGALRKLSVRNSVTVITLYKQQRTSKNPPDSKDYKMAVSAAIVSKFIRNTLSQSQPSNIPGRTAKSSDIIVRTTRTLALYQEIFARCTKKKSCRFCLF